MICYGCGTFQKKSDKHSLRIATYNVRYQNKTDDNKGRAWNERKNTVTELIKKYDFDVFGVQEPFFNQVNDMLISLPGYQRFGISDDGVFNSGSNHHHDIFYKTERLTLMEQGKFWLSPNAPESPPDSLYTAAWGGKAKVCIWGKFKTNYSDVVFYVFNAHFYYANEETRNKSAALVLEKMGLIANGQPAIFMGDLNMNTSSVAYKTLNDSQLLEDSYKWARLNLPKNSSWHQTFNDWQVDVKDNENGENKRIDYIFLTEHWRHKVLSYSIIWDSYTNNGIKKMPSDHNPVVVELKI